jgi:hypothetical protein
MNVSQADYNTFLGTATSFITPNTGFSYSTAIGFGAIISASNQIMLGRVNETVVAPNNITITNTLNGNTLAGKTTTDAISLYTTSTSGGITLGNSTNTNTINGNTTITNTLLGNTITGKLTTDAISLYTTSTSGGITLGNSSNTNTIRGNTTMPDTLFTDNVKGLFAGDNISLFTTTTTGTMNFVSGLTTGICYIGNLLSTTGQMIIYGAVSGTSSLFSNVVAGAINIGSSSLTGVMTIYGSISNTNNLFTNVTTGDINIGSATQTGYTSIYGALTTKTNNLFTNVTTGNINIGTALTSGTFSIGSPLNTAPVFSISGTMTGDNLIFDNVSSGNIYIGGYNQTGDINIGTDILTGDINIGCPANTFTTRINGTLLREVSGNATYYLDGSVYMTTGNATPFNSPFAKYYICNFSSGNNVNLTAPLAGMEGIFINVRSIGSGSCSITSTGSVFINSSNSVVTFLSASTSYRIVCGFKAGSYYWIQL